MLIYNKMNNENYVNHCVVDLKEYIIMLIYNKMNNENYVNHCVVDLKEQERFKKIFGDGVCYGDGVYRELANVNDVSYKRDINVILCDSSQLKKRHKK